MTAEAQQPARERQEASRTMPGEETTAPRRVCCCGSRAWSASSTCQQRESDATWLRIFGLTQHIQQA